MIEKSFKLDMININLNMCLRRGYDGRSLKLDMINLNSNSSWFHSDELEDQVNTTLKCFPAKHFQKITRFPKKTFPFKFCLTKRCYASEILKHFNFRLDIIQIFHSKFTNLNSNLNYLS